MICLTECQPSDAIYLADEFICSYILVHTPAFVQFGLRDLQNSVAALQLINQSRAKFGYCRRASFHKETIHLDDISQVVEFVIQPIVQF